MSILTKHEARDLYDRNAQRYDVLLLAFRLAGIERHRRELVDQLDLSPGDTVVDLCCGTGSNLRYLVSAVGRDGRVIGVDLSSGMLKRARQKVEDAGWENVELIEGDVENFSLPPGTDAVISTFGLEMVPSYDAIIQRLSASLPKGGRLGLLGLKHPESWPDWLVEIGIWLNRPFGVSRDYENFKPWRATESHMSVLEFKELLFGAAYQCVAVNADVDEEVSSD